MKKVVTCLMLMLALSACYSEEEKIDGRWIGQISEEARRELKIDGQIDGDVLVVEFEPHNIRLNDTLRSVEYSSNKGRTLVKFENENRVLTIYRYENDPNRIRMTGVGYFQPKIFSFDLERDDN